MIYTVTFNPSLDYIVSVGSFAAGRTNRTVSEQLLPGGKGINVSTVLHNLGIGSIALGFIAGFTGKEIRRRLDEMGVRNEFLEIGPADVPTDGPGKTHPGDLFSRINVKFRDSDGTELNGMGPAIASGDLERLLVQLDALRAGDTLVLSGSVPGSLPPSTYADLLRHLDGRGICFVVDAEGTLLLETLPYHPFLIKPNRHELEEIFRTELSTRESVIPCARRLQEMGARNVLVSMGGEGAVLADEQGAIHSHVAPKGKLVNAVGAGDSMVAGFLAGCSAPVNALGSGKPTAVDYEKAFRFALAAGTASACSENLAGAREVKYMLRQLM